MKYSTLANNKIGAGKAITKSLRFLGLVFLVLVYFFPFFWMVSTSLKTMIEALAYPPKLFPAKAQWQNYAEAWRATNLPHYLKNSVIVTFLTILGQLFVCVPAAYAFSKKNFKFKGILFGLILFDMLIPAQIIFLPYYVMMSKLRWLDTYQALVVPFIYSSFAIFFMTSSFKQVSNELFDAAALDRANEFQIIFQVLLPICKPVIVTIAIFTFINKWNDYFWATLLTSSEAVRTLPVVVKALVSMKEGVTKWNVAMAGNVMLMLPLLFIYIVANKSVRNAFAYSGQNK